MVASIFNSVILFCPNFLWIIWIPLLCIKFFCLLYRKPKFNKSEIIILTAGLIACVTVPETLKYNIFFIVVYITFVGINHEIQQSDNIKIYYYSFLVLFILSLITPLSFTHHYLNYDVKGMFATNALLRTRGFLTEPAYLGYWSSFLLFIGIRKKIKPVYFIIPIAILVFSFSLGAIAVSLLTLLISVDRKIFYDTQYLRIIFIAIVFGFLYFNYEHIIYNQLEAKLFTKGQSYDLRAINHYEILSYIRENFGVINGFGPVIIGGLPVGVLNFWLLMFKSIGFLSFAFIGMSSFYRDYKATFIGLIIGCLCGNYWETPILMFLAYDQKVTHFKNT